MKMKRRGWMVTVCLVLPALMLLTVPGVLAQPIEEGAEPEKITEGHQFTEGPYWHPDGYLLYSDIPANTVFKWDPSDNSDVIFLKPSGHSNGITADMNGNILLAQHDGMVSMLNDQRNVETLAATYQGKRLNSPNDLVVRSDGTIYFSDPTFGVSDENQELDFSGVYRITPDGSLKLEYDGFNLPNGVVLSPDEEKLYVNNSEDGQIMVFEVAGDGSLKNPVPFAKLEPLGSNGGADGMVTDMEGRLYSTGPTGISIFNPDGERIQHIEMPEQVTNLEWGGENLSHLYVTSPTGVYRFKTNTTGFKR